MLSIKMPFYCTHNHSQKSHLFLCIIYMLFYIRLLQHFLLFSSLFDFVVFFTVWLDWCIIYFLINFIYCCRDKVKGPKLHGILFKMMVHISLFTSHWKKYFLADNWKIRFHHKRVSLKTHNKIFFEKNVTYILIPCDSRLSIKVFLRQFPILVNTKIMYGNIW